MSTTYERIYRTVRRIPRGRVATYGQIAELAGLANHARQVGYALSALPEDHNVPWFRVVNARGEISLSPELGDADRQRERLVDEGIEFTTAGRIDLKRFRWKPRVPR